ncbi:cytochrome C biosynthesis protein [Shewanella eurypsychrophilus]|uniref:Cytochrome C biosynthesis protein n=1 Tax=Shewanella eurypsychrophilus TaxID=2593656 RepID=A0ABX6VBJ7_9GAMM|nr:MULTISPECIES: cytochrome C biosynthesis protein [Shewanella]QFU24695.1 cytochrome C biosynthesis protein [Shewanella sp. YLB-09]QPG59887.1 cytochrome C biosynthesis protein [Shewanella eurypsychrophilus]
MNTLLISFTFIIFCLITITLGHHTLYGINNSLFLSGNDGSTCLQNGNEKKSVSSKGNFIFVVAINLIMIISIFCIYSSIGRHYEIDFARPETNVDYLLAAKINKNIRTVDEQPSNQIALVNLSQSQMDGGLYMAAIQTLDSLLLLLTGEDAEVLGLKATAMYYRDDRTMTMETSLVIARALALNNEELNTRLLVANHAFLNGHYQEAIDSWTALLNNKVQYFNRDSIDFAINKAYAKIKKPIN